MSRSYKRPYAAFCGWGSARTDKQIANRGVRRKQNAWLRKHWHEEEMRLVPHRYECSHNDVWSWRRDGNQYLQVPDARCWSTYCLQVNQLHPYDNGWWSNLNPEWPPRWYEEITRK